MASTYPTQLDVFPGAPYTDGIEFVLAAYANFWISAIGNLESTIGAGSGTSSTNPLYSTTYARSFSTLAARFNAVEAAASGGISINPSAGNIQAVGTTAAAGSTGLAADSSHVHVGVTASSTTIFTNKTDTPRVVSVTAGATPSINVQNGDQFVITGLNTAVTSFTTNLTGTPFAGQLMMIIITDSGSAQGLTWGSSFVSSTILLPTTTVGGQILHVGFRWNNAASKWVCIGTA